MLAEVTSPSDLHNALRQRADQLGVTREVLDQVSGLTSGYSSKLLAPEPSKMFGRVSLSLMLSALGCRLVLLADPTAAPFLARLPKRQRPPAGPDHWRTKRKAAAVATALQAASAALNAARNEKLSREERRSIASAAARARWDARRR